MREIEGYGPRASQIVIFLLATVAMPIDSAHNAYAYFLLMRTTKWPSI